MKKDLRFEVEAELAGYGALLSLNEAAETRYFTERYLRNCPIPKRKIRGRIYFAKEDLVEFLVNDSLVKPL